MDFSLISIRGRFSYALKCLDLFGRLHSQGEFSLHEEYLRKAIVLKYSEFTSCLDLSEWHYQCREMTPAFYTMNRKEMSERELKYITLETGIGLKKYFENITGDFKNLYQLTFDIAQEHLYSIVEREETLLMLSDIVDIMNKNGIILPDYSEIKFSCITENKGWGNKFFWEDLWK